jgi:signal transduction histidine kinase
METLPDALRDAGGSHTGRGRRAPLRYAVAVAVTVVAWLLTVLLDPKLPAPNYLPFAAAVAVSTWFGGARSGLVTSVLSVAAIDFSFLPPISSVEFTHSEELLDIAVFVIVAAAIGATTAALRRARSTAELQSTHLARANTELTEQIEAVRRLSERLDRTREEVLAMVAHDLRNPLHLLVATTELLEDPVVSGDRRRELAAIARRAAQQMNRLIADLLDRARIRAGQLSLVIDTVPVRTLVSQAVETYQPLADERGVELRVDNQAGDATVCADLARAQQVLDNLIGNALKFTERGGSIQLRTRVLGPDVELEVSDTGSGIPPDDLPHLFERFWQRRKGDQQGIGLGLVIAKAIVEAHGGRIHVASTPREGSTFTFTLPRESSRSASPTAGARSPDRPTATSLTPGPAEHLSPFTP